MNPFGNDLPALLEPVDCAVIDTHTNAQNEFIERINTYGTENALSWLRTAKNNTELLYPSVLKFAWEDRSCPEYIFEISTNEDFSDAFIKKCDVPMCEMTNFEIGKKYFWRVNGGKANTFFTKDNYIRFINIDGVLNVRDLGANKIKQGLVYRGSALDGCYKITSKGKAVFKNELKIKTEIDLRAETDEKDFSVAGDGVSFKRLPYRPYMEVFETEHKIEICKIMEVLSDRENYPVYIHCLRGADRTGMIAMFLRALAGESDESIHLDYEMTALATYTEGMADEGYGIRNRNSDYYTEFLNELAAYAPTGTLSEKVKAFLLDCGVTNECIKKIIDIIIN